MNTRDVKLSFPNNSIEKLIVWIFTLYVTILTSFQKNGPYILNLENTVVHWQLHSIGWDSWECMTVCYCCWVFCFGFPFIYFFNLLLYLLSCHIGRHTPSSEKIYILSYFAINPFCALRTLCGVISRAFPIDVSAVAWRWWVIQIWHLSVLQLAMMTPSLSLLAISLT